jgi:hypothetical protein
MTPYRLHRISWIAACAIVGLSSATPAHGQTNFDAQQTEALSAAAKASPDFVEGLAKELGSTSEQAAGAAGVLFTITKALLKPEDFAQVEKAVPRHPRRQPSQCQRPHRHLQGCQSPVRTGSDRR